MQVYKAHDVDKPLLTGALYGALVVHYSEGAHSCGHKVVRSKHVLHADLYYTSMYVSMVIGNTCGWSRCTWAWVSYYHTSPTHDMVRWDRVYPTQPMALIQVIQVNWTITRNTITLNVYLVYANSSILTMILSALPTINACSHLITFLQVHVDATLCTHHITSTLAKFTPHWFKRKRSKEGLEIHTLSECTLLFSKTIPSNRGWLTTQI